MDICDVCEDAYLFEAAAKDEQVAAGRQVNDDLEKMVDESEKETSTKADEVKTRLQAKQLKYSRLVANKQEGAAGVWEKAAEANHNAEDISKQEEELDKLAQLVELATGQIQQMEAEPFHSLQDDVRILQSQNGKLTRELLKLDKSMSDVQQSMKKLESDIVAAYDNWEQKQLAGTRPAGKQKCVIF